MSNSIKKYNWVVVLYPLYLFIVAIGVFQAQSKRLDLPGPSFSFLFHVVPCLISWAIITTTRITRVWMKVVMFVLSITVFAIIWDIQRRYLFDFVMHKPGLFGVEARNWLRFSNGFFNRALVLAFAYTLVFFVMRLRNDAAASRANAKASADL
jgi:hypothetical protein